MVHEKPRKASLAQGQFPNDPVLVYLPQMMDATLVLALVNGCDELVAENGRFTHVQTKVVKYVAGDRCVLRHTFSAGDVTKTLYSKTFRPDEAAANFHNLRSLWESEMCQTGQLHIPQPYFFAQQFDTLFSRALPGELVTDVLEDIDWATMMIGSGKLLAALHQCQISGLAQIDHQMPLNKFYKVQQSITHYNAAFGNELTEIGVALERVWATLPPMPTTVVHTAFRLSQMMVDNGRLSLLDFDGLKNGNPIDDVGSFVAHLYKMSVKNGASMAEMQAAADQFCAGYAAAAPWGLPEAWLKWQTAVILITKHANRCVRRARKNPDAQIRQYLTLAAELLEQA